MRITTLGFPRIGKNRELKFLLESFWRKEISEKEFLKGVDKVKKENLLLQVDNGVEIVPVGDFSLYDSMLDTAWMFGCAGKRFKFSPSASWLEKYFVYARGDSKNPALEMTKWFDTNYHYIVPEVDGVFSLEYNWLLDEFKWAKKVLSGKKIELKPVLIGPYTFIKLSKPKDSAELISLMEAIFPLYREVIKSIVDAGARYFQIDEPALVYGEDKKAVKLLGEFYSQINAEFGKKTKFILQTYFGSIEEHFKEAVTWGFEYIGLDMVRGREANLKAISCTKIKGGQGFVLGVVDGRNVWRTDYSQAISLLKRLSKKIDISKAMLSPSSSLQFVPYTVEGESLGEVQDYLAFAIEKLGELRDIRKAIKGDKKLLSENKRLFSSWAKEAFKNDVAVKQRMKSLSDTDFNRPAPFKKRFSLQKKALGLPMFPTTTIGSFPQTQDVRRMRRLYRTGQISRLAYDVFIAGKIREVIRIQEGLGLDVLVHGEFERTDMVEFFGIKMKGFAFTRNGWVQSYGSRCVRPPIIYGDVSRPEPMTINEVRYAQEQTDRPVKGMLTGPITILNWSFVRTDIPRRDVAYQIALALRDEVADLQSAGISIIQVDEPALREGLPLKRRQQKTYLNWAVKAFRLATAVARPETQIHTHMCYSDFNDIIEAISAMDADVISIENARSRGELLDVFKEYKYDKCIGPGVYDIHSKRVPPVSEMVELLEECLRRGIRKELLWVNPDCGLKTRDWPETKKALLNMVKAAKIIRDKYASKK